jgi:hypothetical protein
MMGCSARSRTFLCWFLFCLSPPALSQYADDTRERSPERARFFAAGVLSREFEPRGSNPLTDSLAIRYNRLMPVISFHQDNAEIIFGYTTYDLDGSSKSTVYFGAKYAAEFPIVGRRSHMLSFPLAIGADFTKAEGAGPSRETFNIASIGLGAGVRYSHSSVDADVSLEVLQYAHYSSEGFSVGTGFSAATTVHALLMLRMIRIGDGVAAGYRVRLQTWSMSESKFNYRTVSHGPYLGILF